MSIQTLLSSRTSTPTRRRPIRRRPLASRLCLESLEDRCLLSFSPAVSYPVGTNPQAVVTGDFNGDGRPDLAVANSSSNSVSILLGNANGTFQAARNIATGIGPISVAVGDFNKDGKLDLATGNALDVSVLLGNGNGTFGTPSNTSLGTQEHSVAVGDFNGDGKLDLGVASSIFQQGSPGDPYYGGYPSFYYNYATVLLGNGTGALSSAGSARVGNGDQPVRSAAVADFNADGRDDFVTLNSVEPNGFVGDYATVLLDNPDGSLDGRTSTAVGLTASFGADPRDAVADGRCERRRQGRSGDGEFLRRRRQRVARHRHRLLRNGPELLRRLATPLGGHGRLQRRRQDRPRDGQRRRPSPCCSAPAPARSGGP